MKKSYLPVLCSMLLVLISSAAFSQRILMSVEASKQGQLKGEGNSPNTKNKIEVIGFSFETLSPRDLNSGMASGRRQHQPLIIDKAFGNSSLQLLQALNTNEVLKTVTLEFYRVSPDGREEAYYTIKLLNATISDFKQFTGTGPGVLSIANPQRGLFEEIKIDYQRIELQNNEAKVMTSDSWQ